MEPGAMAAEFLAAEFAGQLTEGVACPNAIDIIEAALNEAKQNSGPTSARAPGPATQEQAGGMSYSEADAANISAYGARLRHWIDIQVDTRLDMLLAGRAEESAVALAGVQRVEAEMEAIKEMQSRLFAVVEGFSDEMNRVKVALSGKTQAKMLGVIETLSKELTGTRSAVDELKFANASIAEDMGRLKTSIASCELAIKDASAEVRAEARQVDCTEVRLRRQVEDSQDRLGEDIANLQRRLVAELRAETVAALQSESDAIARLDKRLWMLDQRLERRLDDLIASGGGGGGLQIAFADQNGAVVSRSQSPQKAPHSLVYSPGWSIVGGRLISVEPDTSDRRMSLRHVTA